MKRILALCAVAAVVALACPTADAFEGHAKAPVRTVQYYYYGPVVGPPVVAYYPPVVRYYAPSYYVAPTVVVPGPVVRYRYQPLRHSYRIW